VPLEFPDEPLPDVPLDCPSCQRAVCSTCRSKWHSGLVSYHVDALWLQQRVCAQQEQQQEGRPCQQHRLLLLGHNASTVGGAALHLRFSFGAGGGT
jgi:hypothetical protein